MPVHSSMTGADLHESKGVDTASANTVYSADGSGSGSWVKITPSQVDTATFLNMNREQMFGAYIGIGAAGSRWLSFTRNLTIVKINAVVQDVTGGSATILTFRNHAGASMGTISIPSTAVGGDTFSLTPGGSNTFLADQHLQVDSDGGTSGNPNVSFTFDLLWTP